jgi:AraC-like DNA-binding protein
MGTTTFFWWAIVFETGLLSLAIFLLFIRSIPPKKSKQIIPELDKKSAPQILFTEDKRTAYIEKLDGIRQGNFFLQKDYHIRDLSTELDIPVHHVSFLINSHYNLHFQDYVNGHRVEFLIANYQNPDWQHLTLEGMAWEVGFKSRTTFFRAFLKYTGQPPSQYFLKKKVKPGVAKA